jgi:hypothetical protein
MFFVMVNVFILLEDYNMVHILNLEYYCDHRSAGSGVPSVLSILQKKKKHARKHGRKWKK